MTNRPDEPRSARLLARLALLTGAGCAALALCLLAPVPLLRQARQDGLIGTALGALLLAWTGLAAAWVMARARPRGSAGRAARRPQAVVVPAGAALAAAAAWLLRSSGAPPSVPAESLYLLGGAAILLAFPLLIAERIVAAIPAGRLPEARPLAALMLLPVVLQPLAGCLEIAAGLGFGWTHAARVALALFTVGVSLELALRASANWFLPPADPDRARAAIDSLLARLARPAAVARGGIAAPIRNHFGIDFARSWALAYMRDAAPPVLFALLLFVWALTGASLIGMDERGIYERFGAPVAVLRPGLHVVLPWPLGRIRRVEYGVVHSTALSDAGAEAEARAAAEDAPPPSADRLWEQAHPSEVSFLIASRSNGAETFQTVSADIRVAWRAGLTPEAARRAAYSVADPEALVRAAAGRLVSRFFAARTLPDVLGADREAVADGLRAELQAELDGRAAGIEAMAVVIEAVHPPAGAAEAYHNVQAAEIMARENVASERGRAVSTGKLARTQASKAVNDARGAAADAVGAAQVDLRRFTADQAAAAAGGQAFLLERYLGNLSAALPKAPLVIVDHRLNAGNAPVLDLRPLAGAARAASPDED